MNGSKDYILSFIKSSRLIDIPYYQRNYDWKLSNCQRLMEDLYKMIDKGYQNHFFGSIVVKPGEKHSSSIIIDGQQRITTVTLLALAIYNYIIENDINTYANPDSWYRDYLVDQRFRGETNLKLRSNPRDYKSYEALYSVDKNYIENSNITRNYRYFYDQISSNKYNLDELMEVIEKLEIIVINLDSPTDDAQLIFESLNSTGLDLSEADKIRNYLLMNEKIEEQNYLFNNYWTRIEDYTGFEIDDFTRNYLTMKNSTVPKKNKVYEDFKYFYENNFLGKKREFFDEYLEFAKLTKEISTWSTESKQVNHILKRFVKIDVTVLKPFLMRVLFDFKHKLISENQLEKMLSVVESYIARRSITRQSSNSLNKVFSTLYRDIQKYKEVDNSNSSISDILVYILKSKPGSAIFPDDELLRHSFRSGDFYNINSKFRTYLFERLENKDTVEVIEIYKGVEEGEFSIEHIMPQKLSSSWKKMLGEDYNVIHETYLNSIGNLTITGYNTKYSNRPFFEKQNIENGFKDSKFIFLNKLPAQEPVWTEEQIKNRTNILIERALKIWKIPETNFFPMVKKQELEPFLGDDFHQFTGKDIHGYTFINDEYIEQKVWVDMYVDILKQLYDKDPNRFIQFINSPEISSSRFFKSKDSESFKKIDENIYAYKGISNATKFYILNKIFEKYGIAPERLMINAGDKRK